MSWHKYGGIGHDSKFKNLMSNNLASNEIAKMNKLYANNICVAHDVDISGTLDVSGHSQLCDVSACNVDISQNLRAGIGGLTSAQLTGGVGSINNPRIIYDVSDNVIIGEGALNGLNPSAPYTKQNVVIGKNAMFNHNTTSSSYQNVAVGDSALEWCLDAEQTVAVGLNAGSYFGGTTGGSNKVTTRRFGCTYIGAATFSKDNSVHSNETVIGDGAVGMGGNTVQIGNCDVSDVYLGCDGSGTTLHVDDISASNVDISGSLTVEGVDFFKVRPISYIDVSATSSSDQSLSITSELIRDYPIINLNTGAGRTAVYTYNLSDVSSVHNPTLEGRNTTFGTEFIIVGSGIRTTKLVFNTDINDTVTPREISWVGKSIGGTRLTWDGGAWSVADCFNQSTVTSGTGASLI